MSRQKVGVDYFPLDVHNDDKLNLVEAEFGILGWAIIIKLYQRIYTIGYFTKWTEDEILLFKKQVNVDINSINDVISRSIERNIFNAVLFKKYQILTSAGIQRRYIDITIRRKAVYMDSRLLCEGINDYIIAKNVDIIFENADSLPQSKVKESKVKESKGKNDVVRADSVQEIFDYWNQKNLITHTVLTPEMRSAIKARMKYYPTQEIITAIARYDAIVNNPKYWLEKKWTIELFFKQKNAFPNFLHKEAFSNYLEKDRKKNSNNNLQDALAGVKFDEQGEIVNE